MTAQRVVDTHSELADVSNYRSHSQIDRELDGLALGSSLVLSHSAGRPNTRMFAVGTGLSSSDNGSGTFTLSLDAATALSSDTHKGLRQLIHFIGNGPGDGFFPSPYKEVSGFPFVDRITWWDSSSMQKRVYQTEFTRSVNKVTTSRAYKLFATDGLTIVTSAVDVITYVSGVFETSRTRTFT